MRHFNFVLLFVFVFAFAVGAFHLGQVSGNRDEMERAPVVESTAARANQSETESALPALVGLKSRLEQLERQLAMLDGRLTELGPHADREPAPTHERFEEDDSSTMSPAERARDLAEATDEADREWQDRVALGYQDVEFADAVSEELSRLIDDGEFRGTLAKAACSEAACRLAFEFDESTEVEESLTGVLTRFRWISSGYFRPDPDDPSRAVLYALRESSS